MEVVEALADILLTMVTRNALKETLEKLELEEAAAAALPIVT